MTHTFHHPKHYKEMRAERRKLQAASSKPQAFEPTCSSSKPQASSVKLQAASFKPEVTSSPIREPGTKKYWTSFEDLGPRASTKINVFLGCDLWKAIWCGENLTLFPFVHLSSKVKKWPELLYPNRSGVPSELRFSILVHEISLIFLRTFWYNLASGPIWFLRECPPTLIIFL